MVLSSLQSLCEMHTRKQVTGETKYRVDMTWKTSGYSINKEKTLPPESFCNGLKEEKCSRLLNMLSEMVSSLYSIFNASTLNFNHEP